MFTLFVKPFILFLLNLLNFKVQSSEIPRNSGSSPSIFIQLTENLVQIWNRQNELQVLWRHIFEVIVIVGIVDFQLSRVNGYRLFIDI